MVSNSPKSVGPFTQGGKIALMRVFKEENSDSRNRSVADRIIELQSTHPNAMTSTRKLQTMLGVPIRK